MCLLSRIIGEARLWLLYKNIMRFTVSYDIKKAIQTFISHMKSSLTTLSYGHQQPVIRDYPSNEGFPLRNVIETAFRSVGSW